MQNVGAVLNAIGLVMNMVGVVLVFIWGFPQPSYEGHPMRRLMFTSYL